VPAPRSKLLSKTIICWNPRSSAILRSASTFRENLSWLEVGTDRLSRNVGKELRPCAALCSKRTRISSTSRRKLETSQVNYISVIYKVMQKSLDSRRFNPLKPELNPICYLLALLVHHFLHVSRIRVKLLTIRLLMSYIYGAPILDVSRSHTTTQHSR